MSPRDLDEELERMVDASSLSRVLDGLSEICFQKAEHILTSYQDEVLARRWSRASRRLWKLSEEVEV